MSGTERPLRSFKRYGLRLLHWLMSLWFVPELLGVSARAAALVQAWHLVSRNEMDGDYLEFGVFEGDAFKLSLRTAANSFRTGPRGAYRGRFFAFDSFQGLPDVPSLHDGAEVFAAGEYACTRERFVANIAAASRGRQVVVVDGWFKDTLTAATRQTHALTAAAIVLIDCDLYESAALCLEFLTPLVRTGTILMFDDWLLIGASLHRGESRAVDEWLRKNPWIRLVPWIPFGVAGMTFIAIVGEIDRPLG